MDIPVEDPALDITVAVGCLVASCGSWVDDLGLPVVLHKILEIFAISWSWIWDVMVRQPALKLGLMPLIVGYLSVSFESSCQRSGNLPALLNQVLAVAVDARPRTRRFVNFISEMV